MAAEQQSIISKFNPQAFSGTQQPQDYVVPSVETGRGGAWDIYSNLLKENRVIFLTGEVRDQNCELIKAQLLELDRLDSKKPIFIYIDSPGGSVYSGMSIVDVMQNIRAPVATMVAGMAASMGSVVSAAGTPGMRYALPNGVVMVHQPSSGSQGKQTEMGITYRGIVEIRNRMEAYYTCWMGMDIDNKHDLKLAHQLLEHDTYVNPNTAQKLGLIDVIAEPHPDGMTPAKQKFFDLQIRQNKFEYDSIKMDTESEEGDLKAIVKQIAAVREQYLVEALELDKNNKPHNPFLPPWPKP